MADKITIPLRRPPAASGKPKSGLGVLALASIVISSMIGGGIYSLPQNMAAGASAGAVLLAWVITGFGVFFIANTFRILSTVKPDLTAGIYMYSREGFGPYVGFTIGWSYWLCQICGNVGYAVITMDALNYFFPPYFAGGNQSAVDYRRFRTHLGVQLSGSARHKTGDGHQHHRYDCQNRSADFVHSDSAVCLPVFEV